MIEMTRGETAAKYPGGMPGRTFSVNGMALSRALKCSLSDLRQVALRHIQAAIVENEGSAGRIADALGVSLSTYQLWVAEVPEVRDLHLSFRGERVRGPVPKQKRVNGARISPEENGKAISKALKCDLEDLQRCALKYVHAAIVLHQGSSYRVAQALGVGTSTYNVWAAEIPEVRELHLRYRPDGMPGPVPPELQDGKHGKRRKVIRRR